MQKRTRFDPPVIPIVVPVLRYSDSRSGNTYDWNGPNGNFWKGQLFWFPPYINHMDDVVGNERGFNPVSQFELKSSGMSSLSAWHNSAGGIGTPLFGGIPVPSRGSALLTAASLAEWAPVVSASSLSDWAIEAYDTFHAQVPTTISLPNFLYELKDMKSMIPSIDRLSLSKTAANNFLGFEFGIQPFISDIKGIIALSDSVQKRIKHLISVNNQSTRLSFNKELDLSSEPVTHYLSLISNSTDWSTRTDWDLQFKRLSAHVSFHCGAKLFQDLRDLSSSLSTLKALTASSGFSSPLRAVWNAIPYSFVVDWFFHVGKILDSLTIQPFGGEYRVTDISYSVKSECFYEVNQVSEQSPSFTYKVGGVRCKSYIRRSGYPASSLFLTSGMLDPTKQVLLLAMLEQKRR